MGSAKRLTKEEKEARRRLSLRVFDFDEEEIQIRKRKKLERDVEEEKKFEAKKKKKITQKQREERVRRVQPKTDCLMAMKDIFNISGVYFLVSDGEVVYVGESKCIITRIATHNKEGKKEFDSFYFRECDGDENERRKMEKNWIKQMKPIYNEVHNPDARQLSKYGRKYKG